MEPHDKPIANPLVVLREEFDDWAILFDPDTGNAFGLNPTGVYLWKLLDGSTLSMTCFSPCARKRKRCLRKPGTISGSS